MRISPIYYEDVDYCLRVSSSGKRLVIAEEVFVYHWERHNEQATEKDSSTDECEQKLLKTWRSRLIHKREVNLRALNAYLGRLRWRPLQLVAN